MTWVVLVTTLVTFAQTRTITGRVVDSSDGLALPGATIALVSKDGKASSGTTADLDGKFTFTVPTGAKSVVVRFMGYTDKTVALRPNQANYVIRLDDQSRQLSDVVVTGYQKIDRRKLTASVTTVKIDESAVGTIHSVDQALAGQVAGLSSISSSGAPGAPVKIRIRGTASINGTQDPLWVLDGMPLEGTDIPSMEDLKDIDNIYQTSIAGINPADIESVTVLKDAAATAIYGARAANGVIVITTKKGKKGSPTITFSTKLTVQPKSSISRLNLLNSDEKVGLELGLLSSAYTFRENKGDVARILEAEGLTDAYKAGGWDALTPEAQQKINALRTVNTDWNDILFRNVFNQEYNFSLSGGGDKATYYTSVGYDKEQGNVEGVSNDRLNLTLKTEYQINKMLKLGASVYANERNQHSYLTNYGGFTNPVYYSRWANPYMTPYTADNDYNYDVNIQGGKEDSNLNFNIFEERNNTSNRRKEQSLMALFDAELKITKHLKVTSQFGLQLDNSTLRKYAGGNSYAMRKEHEQSIYAYSTGKRSFLPDGGSNKVTESHQSQWTWKAMAEYDNRFAEKHDVEVMLGTEIRHTDYSSVYTAAYGYDDRTLNTIPVIFPTETYAKQFPLYTETHTENAFVSWFATASYTYAYKYTIGGSIRFDGSDVFGVAKKYRYLPLYSVSGLWKVKEESWLQSARWLNSLNIRASYGLQGNIDKNTSPYLIGVYRTASLLPGKTETVIQEETAPNPDLRWEKTQNVNVGVDFTLFNSAISFGLNYYYRRGSDLIGMRMLPLETGFASTTINWATMENSGWEISFASRNIHNKNFTWTTNLNIGINKNKILRESVAENATTPSREGYPVGAIFAYRTAGLDAEGYPLFLNKDGEKVTAKEFLKLNQFGASSLTAAEQRDLYTYIGNSDPLVSGGFINNLKYKDFTLDINCIFNFGGYVRTQPSYSPTNYDRGQNVNRDILNRWTPENPSGTMPRLMVSADRPEEYIQYSEYNLYSMMDTWVKRCNYFRIQSIRLGYSLPKKLLSHVFIKSASVSFEMRNLCVIASDYTNYLDPETMGNPYATPIPKSFIFGLNVGF